MLFGALKKNLPVVCCRIDGGRWRGDTAWSDEESRRDNDMNQYINEQHLQDCSSSSSGCSASPPQTVLASFSKSDPGHLIVQYELDVVHQAGNLVRTLHPR